MVQKKCSNFMVQNKCKCKNSHSVLQKHIGGALLSLGIIRKTLVEGIMLQLDAVVCVFVWALSLSLVQLLATPRTVAHQDPLSMGFSRQERWSGFPFPTPGDLPNRRIEPMSLASPALADGFFITESPGSPCCSRMKRNLEGMEGCRGSVT